MLKVFGVFSMFKVQPLSLVLALSHFLSLLHF